MSFTDEQIAQIAEFCCVDDLCGELPDIADHIGIESAIKLADRLGGVTTYLKRWSASPDDWSHEIRRFIDVIGIAKTEIIVRAFCGYYIEIPKCDALFLRYRNNIIKQQAGFKTSASLAREHGLSQRHIKRIKNTPIKSNKQTELF